MEIDRRRAFLLALTIASNSINDSVRAQPHFDFDPVAIAKLRAGEIAREISATKRDRSVPKPSRDAVFNTGLLLQAGLRALLPVQERKDVALPGTPSSKDPIELVEAQENYKAVFASGAEATPAQRGVAFKAVELASRELASEGYKTFAKAASDWVAQQRAP